MLECTRLVTLAFLLPVAILIIMWLFGAVDFSAFLSNDLIALTFFLSVQIGVYLHYTIYCSGVRYWLKTDGNKARVVHIIIRWDTPPTLEKGAGLVAKFYKQTTSKLQVNYKHHLQIQYFNHGHTIDIENE